MSQDQRPGVIRMVDGDVGAGAPGTAKATPATGSAPAGGKRGSAILPVLLFVVAAAGAGAAVTRLGL